MLDDKTKNKIAQVVSMELATICKFYKVDFFSLKKPERDMLIEIFQAGTKWQELLKDI